MDWLTKMNAALDYIEKNLTGDIDFDVVAQEACCSSYNFQRMFSFITDVSLAEYIRRRKLTQAALEIQNSDMKIIDIAVKYGYDSPTSFARAFQGIHGITPALARTKGVTLKAFPRISFYISIKGEKSMDYRIETKEAFDIFGIEEICSSIGDANYMTPAQLWQKCHANGEYERLLANSGDIPRFLFQSTEQICKIHGAEHYRKTDKNTFPYMLCAFVGQGSKTEGYLTVHVPAQTYVVLPSPRCCWNDFSKELEILHKKFYSEWLPASNYERADSPNFEIYGGTEEYGYLELWYPITKK